VILEYLNISRLPSVPLFAFCHHSCLFGKQERQVTSDNSVWSFMRKDRDQTIVYGNQ
jgi:hypothetical protein